MEISSYYVRISGTYTSGKIDRVHLLDDGKKGVVIPCIQQKAVCRDIDNQPQSCAGNFYSISILYAATGSDFSLLNGQLSKAVDKGEDKYICGYYKNTVVEQSPLKLYVVDQCDG